MDAVTAANVDTWLGLDGTVDVDRAALAITMSTGWIAGVTSLSPMPPDVPADVWSAWLELAGIAYDNPTSFTSNQAGEEIIMYAGGSQDRRTAILTKLEATYPQKTSAALGSFDSAFIDGPWPDSARDVNTFGHLGWAWWGR